MQPMTRRLALMIVTFFLAADAVRAGDVYVQTNLVSNTPGVAPVTDPNLQGAWGMSFTTTSPFWLSNQAGGTSTLYSVSPTNPTSASIVPLVVPITNQGAPPAPPNPSANGPTGQVAVGAPGITTQPTDFLVNGTQAHFIFANLDGSISGWNGTNPAVIQSTTPGASFTGLAIGNLPGAGGAAQLYAADQNSPTGAIDVLNSKFQMTGSFNDPNFSHFPSGFSAFNVQNLNVNGTQTLFVTYANQAGVGGVVDEFSTNGTFIKTLISDTAGAHLASPWGLTIAPTSFGQFGGDLLVGNDNPNSAGLTEINAYNLTTGAFDGTLTLANGQPFSESNLWALSFGSGQGGGGSADVLYFTSGQDNNTNGLFGAISAVSSVPEPSSAVLGLIAVSVMFGGMTWNKHRHRA
jgi:uncharacterized protein (TIGR03118 family)